MEEFFQAKLFLFGHFLNRSIKTHDPSVGSCVFFFTSLRPRLRQEFQEGLTLRHLLRQAFLLTRL